MKKTNWFWAIFLILAAVLLIASQIVPFTGINFWTLLATVVLVAIVIQSCIKRAWFGLFFPLGLLYMLYREPLGLPDISFWIILVASVLISVALHIIFRSKPKKCAENCGNHDGARTNYSNDDDNNPSMEVKFGDSTKYLRSENLTSGSFIVHFGNLEVFFDKAKVSENGAELFLDCSFGAIHLYIPREWEVDDRAYSSMGGITYKNQHISTEGAPKIRLTGNVRMGGVEVIYI